CRSPHQNGHWQVDELVESDGPLFHRASRPRHSGSRHELADDGPPQGSEAVTPVAKPGATRLPAHHLLFARVNPNPPPRFASAGIRRVDERLVAQLPARSPTAGVD